VTISIEMIHLDDSNRCVVIREVDWCDIQTWHCAMSVLQNTNNTIMHIQERLWTVYIDLLLGRIWYDSNAGILINIRVVCDLLVMPRPKTGNVDWSCWIRMLFMLKLESIAYDQTRVCSNISNRLTCSIA
jgi:hypothetical protein